MGDIDVIAQRIMQGVSQSLTDLNKVVAAKNAAEDGERKRIAWEREEAFNNKEVDYKTTPMYMTLPPDQKAMVDKHFVSNGYVEEGKSMITNRNMKEATQSLMQNDATMKSFMESAVAAAEDRFNNAFQEYNQMPDRNAAEKEKKAERFRYVEEQRMNVAKLKKTTEAVFQAQQTRIDTQTKLSAEVQWHKDKNAVDERNKQVDLQIAQLRTGAENKMLTAQQAERDSRFVQAYTQQELEYKAQRAKGLAEAKGDPKKMAAIEDAYNENMKALQAYAARVKSQDINTPLYQKEFKPIAEKEKVKNAGMAGSIFGPTNASTQINAFDPTSGSVEPGTVFGIPSLAPEKVEGAYSE